MVSSGFHWQALSLPASHSPSVSVPVPVCVCASVSLPLSRMHTRKHLHTHTVTRRHSLSLSLSHTFSLHSLLFHTSRALQADWTASKAAVPVGARDAAVNGSNASLLWIISVPTSSATVAQHCDVAGIAAGSRGQRELCPSEIEPARTNP